MGRACSTYKEERNAYGIRNIYLLYSPVSLSLSTQCYDVVTNLTEPSHCPLAVQPAHACHEPVFVIDAVCIPCCPAHILSVVSDREISIHLCN